ncbi:hypothetical protein [Desulfovibrio piger]|uniref:hypothetical protein n=1 Tax=Desulfovibrio piger TaxID=901 RepID=UPI0039F5FBF5
MSDEREPMTDEELDAIKGRLDAITSEAFTNVPWKANSVGKTISGFEYFGIEGVVDAGLLYDRDYGYENGLGIDGEMNATFIAAAPTDIARLLAEVERLNKVSHYLAERLSPLNVTRRKYIGATLEDGYGNGLFLTREEAVQSWLDEANREVSNAK